MRGAFLKGLAVAALWLAAAAPGQAAGFGIFEQGTKAMGMGGAFTAQADDLSAMFHNAGGLAFVEKADWMGGITWFQGTEAEFQGAAPFPGPNARGEQELLSQPLLHLYYGRPFSAGSRWTWGLGVTNPFGLITEWQDPNEFSGRFLSTKASLRVFDFNPTLGWRVSDNFGIGFGAVARLSDVELKRSVPAINPFTQSVADVGRLQLESDPSEGYGWNFGVLHKYNNSFSWGLSYRSKVDVDYEGDARITQVLTGTPLDPIIAARLPFGRDLPVATEIEFPDMASLGLAFALSPNIVLETDVNWTGWSSFEEVPINFTDGDLPNATIPEHWEDVYNYRAGFRWTISPKSQLRLGYIFDETPQPEAAVSPLLPDADRNDFTIGWGHTGKHTWDLALMYVKFDERERDESFPEEGNDFFGTYNTEAVLLAFTLNW
jgi:long-chain fatty acid transport protein